MLPIVVSPETVKVGLAGAGDGLLRREAFLLEAGLSPVRIAQGTSLGGIQILFIAGLESRDSAFMAKKARSAGILVNVEDAPELCDFHVPAIVRRGDLVLTASTGGRAPGLARRLREWLEERFGPEWNTRMEEMGRTRAAWRAEGLPSREVSERSRSLIAEKGWLQ
ncbi:MAG TPA: NAD(P)-dependent oxidoreductase [Rhizomicrobium sp.]|nr:NAD(P)-dependent oxidoreductase [Rhizomicrobium sp.]